MAAIPKIDVHHHIIPPQIQGTGAGMAGMKVPSWTEETDTAFGASIGLRATIFSASTPGVSHIADPEESAIAARGMNEYCAAYCAKNPGARGFLATVPSLEHTELALRELRYALDVLHADGVMLFTSYGARNGYLGHEDYVPVWEELNVRQAVVLVHPCNSKNAVMFNDQLPFPLFDWPHETGRTAIDLILHRRLQQFRDVKIILSHAGGTLVALVARASCIEAPEFGAVMSAEDVHDQARSFYFDLALSGSPEVLPMILGFARPGHVLFGSDFPHAPLPFSNRCTRLVEGLEMSEEMRKDVCSGAAEKLFPRLKGCCDS